MTTNKRIKSHRSKIEKADNKVSPQDPKALQDVQQPNDKPFEIRKRELLDETQGFMYSQSSKFSSVSRTLVLGILGTVWVLTYSEGKLTIPNYFLLGGLIFGLLFLMADVSHYFWDSLSYHKELYKFDKYETLDDLDKIHEPNMDDVNKRSHKFIIGKFLVLICASISFLIGLIMKVTLT